MKRTIIFLLAVLLLFSACGRQTVAIPDAPEVPATVAAPSGKTVVAPAATTVRPAEETGTTAAETTAAGSATTAAPTTAAQKTTAQSTTAAPPKTTAASQPTEPPKTTSAPTTEPPRPATTVRPTEPSKPATTVRPTEPPRPSTTAAPPTTVPPTTEPTTRPADTCTVRIECSTILDNTKKLKKGKDAFVPKGGVILKDAVVPLEPGDNVFTVLRRACETNLCEDACEYCKKAGGIQMESVFTPVYDTYYVEGIHQIYEMDCGTMSGWMYSVNGKFPEEGSSSTAVSAGDKIVFCYTCDMGDDVGNHFEG